MQLIDDAGKVWHRFWSVRLSDRSPVCLGRDAGWQVHVTGQPPVLALVTALHLRRRRLLAPGGAAEGGSASDG
jgi:hypothetical protein